MNKNRRDLVKILSVAGASASALPSQWTRPVVNSAILPGHAITSCGSVEGCFNINMEAEHFNWPAGSTVATVDVMTGSCLNLSPSVSFTETYAVAPNEIIAAQLLGCSVQFIQERPTDPPLVGCSFWFCT